MNNDTSFQKTAFLILVFCVGVFLLYKFPILYKGPWAAWKLVEITILLVFSSNIYRLDYHTMLGDAFKALVANDWATLPPHFIELVSSVTIREYTGYLYTGVIVYFVYKRITAERFDTALNFDQLLESLSRYFRFARCMITLDPTADCKVLDFSKGPFRLKEKIIPFLDKHLAIGQYQSTPTAPVLRYLIADKAHAALIKTLGRKFVSIDRLHYYERWLFAVFILYAKSGKIGDDLCRQGDLMLGDISYHINGELSLKRVNKLTDKVIQKYRDDPEVKAVMSSHWYVYGVLKELFHRAKSKGTHPSLHFPWLPTVDRTLALVLEETGMPDERGAVLEVSSPESGIECLYPRLHWTNEKLLGSRIESPACEYILLEIEKILISKYDFIPEHDAIEFIQKKRDKAASSGQQLI